MKVDLSIGMEAAVMVHVLSSQQRPKVESYEGKTPALGDHQARALLAAPEGDSLKEPLNKYQKWLCSVYRNRFQTETRPLSPFFIAHGAMFAPFGVL